MVKLSVSNLLLFFIPRILPRELRPVQLGALEPSAADGPSADPFHFQGRTDIRLHGPSQGWNVELLHSSQPHQVPPGQPCQGRRPDSVDRVHGQHRSSSQGTEAIGVIQAAKGHSHCPLDKVFSMFSYPELNSSIRRLPISTYPSTTNPD